MQLFHNIKLAFIKSLTWEDVFEMWRQNEANRPNWIEFYKKAGYSSWEEWRNEFVKTLKCAKYQWSFYEILEPLKDILPINGGSFKSWIERFYSGKKSLTFKQLADLPAIQAHQGINEIIENFPDQTILTGLIVKGNIYISLKVCTAVARWL